MSADRNRNKHRRSLGRLFLLFVSVFLLTSLLGPTIVIVRDTSLSPRLEPGDVVLGRRMYRRPVERGEIVALGTDQTILNVVARFLATFTRNQTTAQREERGGLTLRTVAAIGGDQVSWSDRNVTVRRDDDLWRWDLRPLHPLLTTPVAQQRVPDDHLFLLAAAPGRGDSRVLGPTPAHNVRYRIRRILWPANRRRVLSTTPVASPRN